MTNVVNLRPYLRPLRADVPEFDPNNAQHLRAWEALFDLGCAELQLSSRERLEARIESEIALLDAVDGDPDIEDDGSAEHDYRDQPCVIHGAYQGTNGMGMDCDLRAGDDLQASPVFARRA